MAWWIQEQGMYKFQVIHCLGKCHRNTDGLSQVPCKQCGRLDDVEELEWSERVAMVMW